MDTGDAPEPLHRYSIRWKPIGTWERGGDWAYRSRRPDQRWALGYWFVIPGLYTLMVLSDTVEAGQVGWTLAGIAFVWLAAGLSLWTVLVHVEVDTHGITVVNGLRPHRVRWADIDLVQLDGRPAVTLLTKDRRITCWGLRQGAGDLLPWSCLRRRHELAANAKWIRGLAAASPSAARRA